jgi:S-adenosyl-L-methionine hydrolase (adenosine-forming)
MSKRTITLLTDFGSRSPYVGVLKGVIYNINPEINIVDLSHDVTPYSIEEAAFLLETSYRYFPPRTVHLVVVDPGVGSTRRALLAVGESGYYVGPDNGVLSGVLVSDSVLSGDAADKVQLESTSQQTFEKLFEINAPQYYLQPVSSTFHGRDIFAPVAAWLSMGIDPSSFGDPLRSPVLLDLPRPRAEGSTVVGQVMHVDRFGNLVTNIQRSLLENIIEKYALKGFIVAIGQARIGRHVQHYQQLEPGGQATIYGSSSYLEIVAREASAAEQTGARVGAQVLVGFQK